jgi:crotonobetainyl-CoA:carnitine CoA-transferase CaiB-like acyl-CoA transferase
MAPAECFCTRDGVWLMIAAGTDGLFKKLALAIALPELASDQRFLTNQERSANQDVLHGIIRRRIGELESGPLRTALEDAGVPGAPLYTSKDIYHDPHFRERGAITPVRDPTLGEVWMQGVVPALTRTPGRIETTGPELGADNETVYLGELNLSAAEYQALRDAGVI